MALAFRPFRFSAPCFIVIVALSFMSTGCGSKHPGLVKVGGLVTLDGEPVVNARLKLYPEEGRPSSGSIDNDGRFMLTTFDSEDGAVPGTYTVTVQSIPINNEPTYLSYEDELNGIKTKPKTIKRVNPKLIVPKRYANRTTSKLQVVITPDGADIDLALSSGG